jgi:hypothetical protein
MLQVASHNSSTRNITTLVAHPKLPITSQLIYASAPTLCTLVVIVGHAFSLPIPKLKHYK